MNHREAMKKLLDNFSDEEIMSLLHAVVFQRDLAQKYVNGSDFLYNGSKHENLSFIRQKDLYTEIQAKIKIGDVEVNAPYRVKPENGVKCWIFLAEGGARSLVFGNDNISRDLFDSGNCFKTKEDAQAARDAITKLLKGE